MCEHFMMRVSKKLLLITYLRVLQLSFYDKFLCFLWKRSLLKKCVTKKSITKTSWNATPTTQYEMFQYKFWIEYCHVFLLFAHVTTIGYKGTLMIVISIKCISDVSYYHHLYKSMDYLLVLLWICFCVLDWWVLGTVVFYAFKSSNILIYGN